jgi:phosphatidylserine/phosphatidylglycerophosphate/cardiolipin synthase-like enzyme
MEQLVELPSHLRDRLASALETGVVGPPFAEVSLLSALGPIETCGAVRASLLELADEGVPSRTIARWLRSIASVEARAPQVDLVWSGSEVPGLHARDTRAVFDELFRSATRSIWVSSYAYFDGHKAFGVLADHMDANPEVDVRILLNIQRKWGDKTAIPQLVRKFAETFWGRAWPGERRPRVFYDPRSLELEGPEGVLHAKAVVIDDSSLLVTSANLTEAAFDRNIEIGLLSRDRTLAASVATHFRVLIERGLLKPLPLE